jgi:hypothetical protein
LAHSHTTLAKYHDDVDGKIQRPDFVGITGERSCQSTSSYELTLNEGLFGTDSITLLGAI